MMKEDPDNCTIWKHKWWLAQSSERVGHDGYTHYKFPHLHFWLKWNSPRNTDKNFKKKDPQRFGSWNSTIHTRENASTVQMCGVINVACKWPNGEFVQGTKHKDTNGKSKKSCTHGEREELSRRPLSSTTSWSKSKGTKKKKQITGPTLAHRDERKLIPSTTWKVVHCFWDGCVEDNDKNRFGIVPKSLNKKLV